MKNSRSYRVVRLTVSLTMAMLCLVALLWSASGLSAVEPEFASHYVDGNDGDNIAEKGDDETVGRTLNIDHVDAISDSFIYLPAILDNFSSIPCTFAPTLISPTNNSNLNTLLPLYRWNAGYDLAATGVRMEVAEDLQFTQRANTLNTSVAMGIRDHQFSTNLDPNTTYYWRAKLLCNGIESPYSEVWSFTSGSGGTILTPPTLLAPGNGASVPSLQATLKWAAVSGAVEYRIFWRPVGANWKGIIWESGTETTLSSLDADTTYEWWVAARNDYAIGNDSATWRFTTPSTASAHSTSNSVDSFVVNEEGVTVHTDRTGE